MSFQISIASNMRKSPFFDATVKEGVERFGVYNHMYLPSHFGDPDGEYERLINGVAMWDVGAERQVEIAGPDAAQLIQYLTPRDLSKTKVGQGRYVPICDYKGNLINDPVLLKLSQERYWLSVADSDVHLWAEAIGRERGFDVQVFEPDVSPLAIQGPKAIHVVEKLFGPWVRELKYFWFRDAELNGIPLIVARSGWSKQGGFELYLMDGSRGTELWNLVKEAGEEFNIGPGAPNPVERLESGLISWGGDIRIQTHPANPFEMGMDGLVDLESGHDFVGRAALEKIAKDGPKRRWTGFFIEGPKINPVGHSVRLLHEGQPVGYIGNAIYSMRLQQNIGTGMVRADLPLDAPHLIMEHPEGPRTVTVTPLPFIR